MYVSVNMCVCVCAHAQYWGPGEEGGERRRGEWRGEKGEERRRGRGDER